MKPMALWVASLLHFLGYVYISRHYSHRQLRLVNSMSIFPYLVLLYMTLIYVIWQLGLFGGFGYSPNLTFWAPNY